MLILYLYCNECMIILWNAHNRSNKLLLLLLSYYQKQQQQQLIQFVNHGFYILLVYNLSCSIEKFAFSFFCLHNVFATPPFPFDKLLIPLRSIPQNLSLLRSYSYRAGVTHEELSSLLTESKVKQSSLQIASETNVGIWLYCMGSV